LNVAKGNPMEIKWIVGQCAEEMTLDPEEVKVIILQETPGRLSPAKVEPRSVAEYSVQPHDKLWEIDGNRTLQHRPVHHIVTVD
jgi:hypothetical protein